MNMRWFLIFILHLFIYNACEDTERAEARMLLERLKAIDVNRPVQKRRKEVLQLESLVLNEKKLSLARDRCVFAHKALITAEQQQKEATRIMDKATALDPSASIGKSDLAIIAKAIERSEIELDRAKAIFPSCEREIRKLELRFASSHGLR